MAAHNVRRRERGADEQPGNTFRYLYWRLGEREFQQLCSALLRRKFDPVQCYPVGMADAGIDAISHGSVIYQVKWTRRYQQDPATWLKATLDAEYEKVRKLVDEGRATRYVLMTSVAATTSSERRSASTGAERKGSLQKLQPTLDDYAVKLGIPVECWWQQDIDAEVDLADEEIKWSYPEMLAGTAAIRYLIFGAGVATAAARTRETMTRVLAAQWRDDAHVRFTQVEMEGVSLAQLFVDVRASQVAPPRNARAEFLRDPARYDKPPRGAVETLLDSTVPLTFLLGVPGQGKSTLTQYLCQVHRAVILANDEDAAEFAPPGTPIGEPKLPLRIELKEYAAWVDGYDTFDDERPRLTRRKPKTQRSAENYIAQLCVAASGGRAVTVEDVQSLLERYPCLIVFDGLDEVADPDLRRIVVDEIEAMAARMGGTKRQLRSFQIVVTARPNATGLAEPNQDQFQRLRLEPMDEALQNEFVVKWCDARNIDGRPRQTLRRIFRERTAFDHVSKLADNPMQLAILLYLINKKGDAVPVARTPLYGDYMGTLLDREVAHGHISRNAVPQVQEVTAFLGWHMQAGVETTQAAGAMTRRDIESTLLLYLREVGADSDDATALFRLASDRFWALTSETDELFKFAVQPVREYFAAKFLAEWAGRDMREPLSKQAVLGELLGRPYWLNTARFYAGFASPNELAAMRYGIEDALSSERTIIEHRIAAWALVTDAVFVRDTRVQRDVVSMLTDDLTVMLAHEPQFRSDFPSLSSDSGGSQLARALQDAISAAPSHALTRARVHMLREQARVDKVEFEKWWSSKVSDAAGGREEASWLRVGAAFGVQQLETEVVARIRGRDPDVVVAAIGAGAVPEPGSDLSASMLSAVLAGEASEGRARATSAAGALLLAMRPQWFHDATPGDRRGPRNLVSESARNSAWNKLLAVNPAYADLRSAARKRQKAQTGTTEPWQAPARELARLHGPSWLSAEIAITGAAASALIASGSKDRGGVPFGPNVDYGTLVIEVHRRPEPAWWREAHDNFHDTLSRRTWALALVAAGTPDAVSENVELLDSVLARLTANDFATTAASSHRISQNGSARRLPSFTPRTKLSARTATLLAHFTNERFNLEEMLHLSDDELVSMSGTDSYLWPIAEALAARIITKPTPTLLAGVSALGVDSLSGVSKHTKPLHETIAREILRAPGSYPTEWVLAAERSRPAAVKPVLEAVALEHAWIPRVPRYT